MTRPSLSRKKRVELWELHQGRCHICGLKIDGVKEAWEIEHVIPRELYLNPKDADTDENMMLAHAKCHKNKTKKDIANIAKAKRVNAKHNGLNSKTKVPFLFGKNSPWKKCFDGTVVNRFTGEIK